MTEEKKIKVMFKSDFRCPFCDKIVSMKKIKTLLTKGIPAEYKEDVIIGKSKQQALDSFKK